MQSLKCSAPAEVAARVVFGGGGRNMFCHLLYTIWYIWRILCSSPTVFRLSQRLSFCQRRFPPCCDTAVRSCCDSPRRLLPRHSTQLLPCMDGDKLCRRAAADAERSPLWPPGQWRRLRPQQQQERRNALLGYSRYRVRRLLTYYSTRTCPTLLLMSRWTPRRIACFFCMI